MFQTKRFQSPTRHKEGEEIIPEERPLEDTVDREPIKEAAKEEAEQQYILQLSRTPAEHLADRMQGIYQEALDRGYVSPNQIESATNISYALTEKKAEINLGNYDADQKVKEQILVSGNIIKALKDRYKGR